MKDVVSELPCVIFDLVNGEYAPKGWMYYLEDKPWVKDIRKAKVYRNSAGAKNAMKGVFGRHYRGPQRGPVVVEFHKELERSA